MVKAEAGARRASGARSSRRRSREFALQALYQWQLAHTDAVALEQQLAESENFDRSDPDYFRLLLSGTIAAAGELEALIQPFLDRRFSQLSPVERGVLLLGGYELLRQPEVPYRVVINEAVELAKVYGGTDGHKYVNGVLDKLAAQLRGAEMQN